MRNKLHITLSYILLVCVFLIVSCPTVRAQGRSFIRDNIKKHGECRNVAITKTNGNVMLYGRNGYAHSGCPTGLANAIKSLHERKEYIDDVVLTEDGRWLVLYGNNGFKYSSNIPAGLKEKIRYYNRQKEVVLTAVFNDANEWVVITTKHYVASHQYIQDMLEEGLETYGMLWTVCLTDDSIIAVYENGFRALGHIPDSLDSALSNTTLDVYRLKVAGNSWFFADKNGSYQYRM